MVEVESEIFDSQINSENVAFLDSSFDNPLSVNNLLLTVKEYISTENNDTSIAKEKTVSSKVKNVSLQNISQSSACLKSAILSQLIPHDKITHKKLKDWGLPITITSKYEEKGITEMFDWQVECLGNLKVLMDCSNLVYSAPTSAGKTLVAEILTIKTVLERQKKVIIILPFVSIVREKMFYLQDILTSTGIRVEGFMGSQSPPGGIEAVHVAICTIEKANSLINRLLDEGNIADLGAVVVDEMHLLGDSHRGYILELLLTKIKYVSSKLDHVQIQIIGMSATLPNLDILANWLNAELYITQFRPIPLDEFCLVGNKYYDKKGNFVDIIKNHNNNCDNILNICLDTIKDGCSVLIFCMTKNRCENLAHNIASSFCKMGHSDENEIGLVLRSQLKSQSIMEVLEQLKNCPVGLDKILKNTISFGVAFHHAGLTFDERDIIEGGFKTGAIRVLIATSTLSSGVNLPARRVVIRSPVFQKQPINILCYKQMVGRAGRMGKDSKGESVLICTEAERKIGCDLMMGALEPVKSCIQSEDKYMRAILEMIASQVACKDEELKFYSECTLLHTQQNTNLSDKYLLENTLDELKNLELIRIQTDGEEKRYVATSLGKACLSSSMAPNDGLTLFCELQKARQCLVLETDLHLIYLVTPYSVSNQWGNIDWLHLLTLWESLTKAMKRVGELVGVQESFIIRCLRGVSINNNQNKLNVHKRFYTALALQDLVNEVPLSNVAEKFQCARGFLQGLQQSAATFAGMVTSFCHQLGWRNMEMLISQFQDRLHFGVHLDLLELMKLPSLNGMRARSLFNAGFETISHIASAEVNIIENVLHNAIPFVSERKRDGDDIEEVKKRNKIKNIWITGCCGMTTRDAALNLILEARKYIEHEIGVAEIKWNSASSNTTVTSHNRQGLNTKLEKYSSNKINSLSLMDNNKECVQQSNETENTLKPAVNYIKKAVSCPNTNVNSASSNTTVTSHNIQVLNTKLEKYSSNKIYSLPLTNNKKECVQQSNKIENTLKPAANYIKKAVSCPDTNVNSASSNTTVTSHNIQVLNTKLEKDSSNKINSLSLTNKKKKCVQQSNEIENTLKPAVNCIKKAVSCPDTNVNSASSNTTVTSHNRQVLNTKLEKYSSNKINSLSLIDNNKECVQQSNETENTLKPAVNYIKKAVSCLDINVNSALSNTTVTSNNIQVLNPKLEKYSSNKINSLSLTNNKKKCVQQSNEIDNTLKPAVNYIKKAVSCPDTNVDQSNKIFERKYGDVSKTVNAIFNDSNNSRKPLKNTVLFNERNLNNISKRDVSQNVNSLPLKEMKYNSPSLIGNDDIIWDSLNITEGGLDNITRIAVKCAKETLDKNKMVAPKEKKRNQISFKSPSVKDVSLFSSEEDNSILFDESLPMELISNTILNDRVLLTPKCLNGGDVSDIININSTSILNAFKTTVVESESDEDIKLIYDDENKISDNLQDSSPEDVVISSQEAVETFSLKYKSPLKRQMKFQNGSENLYHPLAKKVKTEGKTESPTQSKDISTTLLTINFDHMKSFTLEINDYRIDCYLLEGNDIIENLHIITEYSQIASLAFNLKNNTLNTSKIIGSNILKQSKIYNTIKEDCTERLIKGISIYFGGSICFYLDLTTLNERLSVISNEISLWFKKCQKLKVMSLKSYYGKIKKCLNINMPTYCFDVSIMEWLIDSDEKAPNIYDLTKKYCDIDLPAGCQMKIDEQNKYIHTLKDNCVKAWAIWAIADQQEIYLSKHNEGFERIVGIEFQVSLILANSELYGLEVDKDLASQLLVDVKNSQEILQKKAYSICGYHFNFYSSKDVAKVLGIYRGRKVSTKKSVLTSHNSTMASIIIFWRKLNSILTKTLYPLNEKACIYSQNNRINPSYTMHTCTGRVSMHEPNLQNVPRTFSIPSVYLTPGENITTSCEQVIEFNCRNIFKAAPGFVLVSADYCQLEMRILTHYCGDEALTRIMRSNIDVFKSIAASWGEVSEDNVDDDLRQKAKQLCYGIIYGMGNRTLGQHLDVSELEAAVFLDSFHRAYPAIRVMTETVIDNCRRKGYIETLMKRRRYLPDINSNVVTKRNAAERQAVNTTIQGSAADIAKAATCAIDSRTDHYSPKPRLILQMHDELIYEVVEEHKHEFIEIIRSEMENTVRLEVPLPVKLKSGYTWGSLEEVSH